MLKMHAGLSSSEHAATPYGNNPGLFHIHPTKKEGLDVVLEQSVSFVSSGYHFPCNE